MFYINYLIGPSNHPCSSGRNGCSVEASRISSSVALPNGQIRTTRRQRHSLLVRYLLLYKCPEVKSTDFKSQEKRERMVGKTVGVHERKKAENDELNF